MRIGVNGRFYGVPVWGVQRFAREVSRRLLSEPDVTLFLPAEVGAPGSGMSENGARGKAVSRGAPTANGSPVRRGRLPGHLWEQLELPTTARRAGCDAVLHLGGTGPLYGGPHVVAIHDALPLTNPEWFSRRFVLWYRSVVRGAARRAAVILTPSEWARGEIVRVFGVSGERVHVVRQGVEPFHAPASQEEVGRVRRRFGLPERYLLAMGGGDARKNAHFLHGVLDRWGAERPGEEPPHLVVVGARRARVWRRAANGRPRGVEPPAANGRIRELGYVTDAELRALYTGARVFCFPSLGEGFGRPPLEAMACGTPAVVAPYGCADEILGDSALILPLEPEAWVDGIASLLNGGEGPEGHGRRERIRAGERHARGFRWEGAARAVLEACRNAAAAGPRRPASHG